MTSVTATLGLELEFEVEADVDPGRPMKVYRDGSADPPDPPECEITSIRMGVSYREAVPTESGLQHVWKTRWLELTPDQKKAIEEIIGADDELRQRAEEAVWIRYDEGEP